MTEASIREPYSAAAQRLSEYAASAEPEAAAVVADQLLAVAALLGREPGLRRALADPTRAADDRADLLQGLLRGKVDEATVGLVEPLVTARWPTPNTLRDAVERLGVDTLMLSAQRAGQAGDVEDELFRFGQVVDSARALAAALGDPAVPVEHREALVADLLDGKARPITIRLVQQALVGLGGRGFSASIARLIELAAAARQRTVAYVISAVPLSDEDERRLGDELSRRYGRQISLQVTVDPTIMGGLSVQIGNDLYDGTILRRINEARAALTR
jgi:F-type H+-transporting ATPase subunit delta